MHTKRLSVISVGRFIKYIGQILGKPRNFQRPCALSKWPPNRFKFGREHPEVSFIKVSGDIVRTKRLSVISVGRFFTYIGKFWAKNVIFKGLAHNLNGLQIGSNLAQSILRGSLLKYQES